MSLRSNGSYIGPRPTGPTNGIAGVASGVWDLRSAQRQRAAGAWPFPFSSPTQITGLQLWLDASDASTLYNATSGGSLVAADGGVARWEDKSGNARHATQGTSANRPARKTAIQGGKDVLRFDGSNDSLSIPSSTATFKFLHSGQASLFIVARQLFTNNSGALGSILFTQATLGSSIGMGVFYNDDDVNVDMFDVNVGRGGLPSLSARDRIDNSMPRDTGLLFSVLTDMASATQNDRVKIRKNGGAESSTSLAISYSTASTADASADLRLGASPESNYHLNGDIAEIIIYDSALSDANREAVENYLLAKWAIT